MIASDIPIQVVNGWSWEMVGRLALAGLLGSIIGLERERHGRSAGFRTQLLVGLGSSLVMLIGLHFSDIFGKEYGMVAVRVDAARALGGVMGGIGFLGAGAILRHEGGIRGLTTAASLWCTAAVGLSCGIGLYTLALVTTGITLFALLVLSRIDELIPALTQRTITVITANPDDSLPSLRSAFQKNRIDVRNVHYERDFDQKTEHITLFASAPKTVSTAALIALAQAVPHVRRVSVS